MYGILKWILAFIFPPRIYLRWKEALRPWVSTFYRGNQVQCNICQVHLRQFIQLSSGDLLCPHCGSLPRQRRLWHELFDARVIEVIQSDAKITLLDFSPPHCISSRLTKLLGAQYLPTDWVGEFAAAHHMDIRQLPLSDQSIHIIICYHVLEHIEEDQKAMQELFRVLQPGGTCWIQVPYSSIFLEDPKITSPEQRLQSFGQSDHCRVYSREVLQNRLEKSGFQVQWMEFKEQSPQQIKLGWQEHEWIALAQRPLISI